MKKVLVIGSGFAGLSSACFLAQKGYKVTVIEKNSMPGGRCRIFEQQGFKFDMGPSWYWMPDVFDRFFESFGKKTSDYYNLKRLDPSYKVFFKNNDTWDIPADTRSLGQLFESIEPGSSQKLFDFLKEAEYKYKVGINDLVYKPSRSLTEFADLRLLYGLVKMDVFKSMSTHIASFFKDPRIVQLLEFPVLFLGAKPSNTPALYSLMNYADISLGTWYPEGGMYEIVKGIYKLALELGVEFHFDTNVLSIPVKNAKTEPVVTDKGLFAADIVVGGADYHHIDQNLLDKQYSNYSAEYWDKRTMAPSSLIYYLGINKRIEGILHHNLFFDTDFNEHASEIYDEPKWPINPLFYVSATSKTDPHVAPEGSENLFILIPTAPGLDGDSEELRNYYLDLVIKRMEDRLGVPIKEHIIYQRSYAHKDFINDYNSFKGNAYGLANTLKQTAILKPALKSKKVSNLYYTGQLTVPGPGVPPSLISGEVVANEIFKEFPIK